MIRFQCPVCRTVLQAPPTLAGQIVACSGCQTRLRVQAPAPAAPPPPVPPVPRPESRRPPVPPLPPAAPAPSSTARRPRHRRKIPIGLIAGLVATLLLLVALVAGGLYVATRPASPVVTREPERPRPAPRVVEPTAPVERNRQPVEQAPVAKAPLTATPEPVEEKKESEPPKPPKPPKPPAPPPLSAEEIDRLVARLLATFNRVRAEEGVPEVTLHREHSQGCAEHARYLARHLTAQPWLDWHDQEADLAGATEAGRAAAHVASVTVRDPVETLRDWLAAPAHRALLLAARLGSVGIGVTRTDDGRWVGVFDWTRGGPPVPARGLGDPIVYPANRQRDVPLAFPGNEVPDPLPKTKDKIAGFPITATFPPRGAVPAARAWLEDEAGGEVPVWFSSPAQPANEKHARSQQNTVCLIARQPLRPGTRYVVRLEARVQEREWARSWSFTTQGPATLHRHVYERACARLNQLRTAAGLDPVTLDDELSRACESHAAYLARHVDRVPGLKPEEELPDLPGYTEEGARVGRQSALRFGGGNRPGDAIDWLFDSILNRHSALNPTMKKVGMGVALHSPRGWIWVIHLPPIRRDGDGPLATLYPGKNQTDMPLYFGREIQSMLPEQPRNTVAGFGITANFFLHRRVQKAVAKLLDADGNPVDTWQSTPDKPLPGTGSSNRQIVLVPKQPLRPATVYRVEMAAEVDGEPWQESWSFTTRDPKRGAEVVQIALLERVNQVRALAGLDVVTLDDDLSSGCRRHADYVVKNLDDPSVRGLGIHDEDPKLPGYSKQGQRAGQNGVIAILSDPLDSVDNWMATLYHRIPLLDARLKRIGYGQTQHPLRGWVTVLDSGTGK